MSNGVDTITRVCLKSSPDYLPRVRRIVGCLADSIGMDSDEADDTKLALTEACVNAIKHGSPLGDLDNVVITFRSSARTITADVTDSGGGIGPQEHTENTNSGFGLRLMRMLADSVQFIRHSTGLTVRLTKRAKRTQTGRLAATAESVRSHRN